MVQLHKYSGAGNDFVVLDGRTEDVTAYRTPERISALCDRETGFLPPSSFSSFAGLTGESRRGADGLMILTADPDYDFRMEFYNPDGSGGMMCGNGGRCIVAFADALGITPRDGRIFRFIAADGEHTGEILARDGDRKTVRLRMIDVRTFHPALDGWFLDTGTRHFVRFVPDVEAVDVEKEGPVVRWDPVFAPIGANANFVSVDPDGVLHVRTFEKGVEGETLACGTGITASAIAAYLAAPKAEASQRPDRNYFSDKFAEKPISAPSSTTLTHASAGAPSSFAGLTGDPSEARDGDRQGGKSRHYDIEARIARLAVDFRVGSGCFTDVYLTGPAEEIPRSLSSPA